MQFVNPQEVGAKEGRTNEYDELHAAGIDIPGRLTLNLWRLLRTELKLGIYTQVCSMRRWVAES